MELPVQMVPENLHSYRYLILGDEKELDIESLEKIAPIRRLTLEEIFGY